LKAMISTAQKYGLKFDTFNPSKAIMEQLPMWHHFAENPAKHRINNAATSRCLRQVHYAHTMEKANNLAWRLSYKQHEPHKECNCHACYGDRDRGCQDPHKCMKAAKMKMDSILPKWDLRNALGNEDELAPDILPPDNGGVITFTDRPTIKDLAEGFRIFT
ncbi:hypothetical protein C8F01DRAFT_927662, partial [Mycena amicta]